MHLVKFQYAKALLSLANDKKISNDIYNDIENTILPILEQDVLQKMLQSPIISLSSKIASLNSIFENKVNQCLLDFFVLIIKNGRGNFLIEVLKSFVFQYEEERSIKRGVITTALSLSDTMMDQIRNMAMKIAQCEKLILEYIIDKNIIGGYVINIDNKQLDCSLKNDLNKINKLFKSNI